MFSSSLSIIMTLVSIVLFCVETLPVFATSHCEHDEAPNFLDPFFIIETLCTAWFTLEIVVRFACCPSKADFCKDVKNLVDVGAILPYYVTLINVLSSMSCEGAKSSASLAFLRVTRLWRRGRTVSFSSLVQFHWRFFVVRQWTLSSRRKQFTTVVWSQECGRTVSYRLHSLQVAILWMTWKSSLFMVEISDGSSRHQTHQDLEADKTLRWSAGITSSDSSNRITTDI